MINTTQLRVLRTLTSPSPLKLPIRVSQGLALNSQHVSRCLPSTAPPRFLSTTSPRFSSSSKTPTITTTPKLHPSPSNATISPTAANPPATTRPAPLNLPNREPNSSTLSFYFATGKAYLTFYKTGLKNVYLNTRLVWSLNAAAGVPRAETPPPGDIATPPTVTITTTRAVGSTTRSTLLLRRRWRHDVRRLPLFALLLLVCGEFTPLVVMAMPKLVPYTCRIPRQVETLQRKAEERRAASFHKLDKIPLLDADIEASLSSSPSSEATASLSDAETAAHIARSLNLISPLWDRLGVPDATLAALLSTQRKVQRHLDFLKEDDALLVQAGGVVALEDEEVVLACVDRAIGTIGRSNEELRKEMQSWLQYIPKQLDTTTKIQWLTERLLKQS